MLTLADGKKDGKEFVTRAPGYFPDVAPELWNDWKWQLQNRVTTLAQLEQHLTLSEEERAGVLLSGDKLALAITPYFFNLIEPDDPDCPIRRQVIPRIEETWSSPYDMADPCGEDSHMPVPGLVHRYPDRVLFLVTDRCAGYCRYCTRSRVVSGVGEQELHTEFEAAFQLYRRAHRSSRRAPLRRRPAPLHRFQARENPPPPASDSARRIPPHWHAHSDLPPATHHARALRRCCKNIIRSG